MLPPGMDQQQFDESRRGMSVLGDWDPERLAQEQAAHQRRMTYDPDEVEELSRADVRQRGDAYRRGLEAQRRPDTAFDYGVHGSEALDVLRNNSSRPMREMIDLVSGQGKLIGVRRKLQHQEKAEDWVRKRNLKIKKPENRYSVEPKMDYDQDGLDDVIVTKGGKIYSFNGYYPRDSDWPLRNAHNLRYPALDAPDYGKKKMAARRNDPWGLKYDFDPDTVYDFPPEVQQRYPIAGRVAAKLSKSPEERRISVYQALGSIFIKPYWQSAKKEADEAVITRDDRTLKNVLSILKYTDVLAAAYKLVVIADITQKIPIFPDLKQKDKAKYLAEWWNQVVTSDEALMQIRRYIGYLFQDMINFVRENGRAPTPEDFANYQAPEPVRPRWTDESGTEREQDYSNIGRIEEPED